MKIALIQLPQTLNPEENLSVATQMIREAKGSDLIVLPEAFLAPFGTEILSDNTQVLSIISDLAKELETIIIAGTVPEKDGEKYHNTCYVFDKDGQEITRYRKIHLFDVDLMGLSTRESERYDRGDELVTFKTPYATIGLAVCYDLRFPEMFTKLSDMGATLIVLPAAFSYNTGKRDWELLNRARALDSQCFLVSCAPAANKDFPFPVYGHSLIVGPNGGVLKKLGAKPGILYYEFDPKEVELDREMLPVTRTRKEIGF